MHAYDDVHFRLDGVKALAVGAHVQGTCSVGVLPCCRRLADAWHKREGGADSQREWDELTVVVGSRGKKKISILALALLRGPCPCPLSREGCSTASGQSSRPRI